MIENLAKQFLGSNEATALVGSLTEKTGLSAEEAQKAVTATAEGTAEVATEGGIGGMLSGLTGGGGLAGALGGALGGGDDMTTKIADIVAAKTGLSKEMANTAVSFILPKIMEFVKGKSGGEGAKSLGGLLG